MNDLLALIKVARAALAQADNTPEDERLSCRTLLEAALPYLERLAQEDAE